MVVGEAPVGETRRAFRFAPVLPMLLAGCVLVGGPGSGGPEGEGDPAGSPPRTEEGSTTEAPVVAASPASGGVPPASTTTPAGTPVREELPRCDATVGQQLLAEVNRVRSTSGLGPLSVDLRLARAAATHSADMARRGALGHRGRDGSEVQDRAERNGYDWLSIAENVASGQPTVADVMGSWMNSPGHRRNILDPRVRHFGAAVARDSAGRTYWTQVFGDTDREPAPSAGGCHP